MRGEVVRARAEAVSRVRVAGGFRGGVGDAAEQSAVLRCGWERGGDARVCGEVCARHGRARRILNGGRVERPDSGVKYLRSKRVRVEVYLKSGTFGSIARILIIHSVVHGEVWHRCR